MKIPFFQKEQEKSKKYLILFLKETEGAGFIVSEQNSKFSVIEKEKFAYANGWENLVEDIDELLFRLENKRKIHLSETMFLIYSHLVDEKNKEIKKEYLARIKEVVKNLELKALGYVECREAVANFLEKKEELPLTATLIELDKSNLGIFIYKGGRTAYSKILARTGVLTDDLTICFDELKGKFLLPSRIILYNSKDLDDESTRILTHKWSEDLFIQLPRVEIIKEEEIFEGLVKVLEEQLSKKEEDTHRGKAFAEREVLGFVVGGEVVAREKKPPRETAQKAAIIPSPEAKFKMAFPAQILNQLKKLFGKINLPSMKFSAKKLSITIGVIFILSALFLNEYFFHKSKLTIFLPTKPLEKSLKINGILDEVAGEDLQIYTASFSADFSEKKATTGKREVGEKARGEVTVHNFDDKEKIFAKGTILEANGIKFGLDDEIKVASSSMAADGSVKLPGKAKAKITASLVGPEGNLGKGNRFKISDLSTSIYFAINEAALTGGTKKEIKTVAKKDMEDLKEIILSKAKKQRQGQLSKKLSKEEVLIEDLTETALANLKYSKELGEEGESLYLQAKAETTAYYYKKEKLLDYVVNALKDDLDEGFKIEKDKIVYKFKDVEEEDDKITLAVDVKAKATKDISQKDLLKKILGKNEADLKDILKDNFDIGGYEVSTRQPLPVFKNKLPFFEKNIDFRMSSL